MFDDVFISTMNINTMEFQFRLWKMARILHVVPKDLKKADIVKRVLSETGTMQDLINFLAKHKVIDIQHLVVYGFRTQNTAIENKVKEYLEFNNISAYG